MFSICRNVSYFIIFSQLSVSNVKTVKSNNAALRVMGGRNATRGEFPYVMRMGLQISQINKPDVFQFACTCSLIKPTWSLTAAHCVEGIVKYLAAQNIKGVIQYDLLNIHGTGFSLILSSFIYPNYRSYSGSRLQILQLSHDIGLLKSEEVPVLRYAKISSVDYATLLGHNVLALGYGTTTGPEGVYDIADNLNKSLQVLDVIAVNCFNNMVTPSFCINGPCWQWSAVCPGDSGGPIVHPSGIVGVNSAVTNVNCRRETALAPKMKIQTFSGIITPTSLYVDWITKTMEH